MSAALSALLSLTRIDAIRAAIAQLSQMADREFIARERHRCITQHLLVFR